MFRFVPFRNTKLAIPRNTEFREMTTLFRVITKFVLSLFWETRSQLNSVGNLMLNAFTQFSVRQSDSHSRGIYQWPQRPTWPPRGRLPVSLLPRLISDQAVPASSSTPVLVFCTAVSTSAPLNCCSWPWDFAAGINKNPEPPPPLTHCIRVYSILIPTERGGGGGKS